MTRPDVSGVAHIAALALILSVSAAALFVAPLTFSGPCVAQGTVLDLGGAPIAEANIYLLKLPGPSERRDQAWTAYVTDTDKSGADGRFAVSSSCGGVNELLVQKAGFDPTKRILSWNVAGPVTTVLSIRLGT